MQGSLFTIKEQPKEPEPGPTTDQVRRLHEVYEQAYTDTAIDSKKRSDVIVQMIKDEARRLGIPYENFDKDLYTHLRPWIVAGGNPRPKESK